MSDEGTNIYLPGQETPLVVPNEGDPGAGRIIERSWYRFLIGLFNRTGGVAGNAQLPSLDVLGDAQIDGDLNVDGNLTVAGSILIGGLPTFLCRAWVTFDATGTILGSGNVASVVRNGVGDFTVNLATPMPDANFAAFVESIGNLPSGVTSSNGSSQAVTAGSIQARFLSANGAAFEDPTIGAVGIFR